MTFQIFYQSLLGLQWLNWSWLVSSQILDICCIETCPSQCQNIITFLSTRSIVLQIDTAQYLFAHYLINKKRLLLCQRHIIPPATIPRNTTATQLCQQLSTNFSAMTKTFHITHTVISIEHLQFYLSCYFGTLYSNENKDNFHVHMNLSWLLI